MVVGRIGNTLPSSMARGAAPGPFFVRVDGFVEQICQLLRSIGLPQHQYVGHSFRIGAVTTAALAGVEDLTIQALGW